MTEQAQKAVPRLRFPEFRDAGKWEVKRLGEVSEILDNKRKPVASTKRKPGPYPYYGASGAIDYIDEYIFDERLLLIGEDGAKWGPFENTAFIVEGKYWVNNHAHVLRPVAINDVLLENYLNATDISVYVTGAAPPKLTLDNLKSIRIPVPPVQEEQQKIADCLGSLDDLIRAEEAALEALKKHKKGLMQQLFPHEGETTPRLRFPEFRDAGEWEVKRLGEIATISNGLTADQSNNSNGLKVTRIETISDGYIDISKVGYIFMMEGVEKFRLKVGDILFSHINSQAHIGKTAIVEEDLDLYHGMNLLRIRTDNKEYNPRFIYYILNTSYFRKSIQARANQAVNQASINQTELGNSKIAVPSTNEQQKIADFLSSLDDLIRAKGDKIEALKQHKKGLMQRLFPQEEA